MKLIRIVCSYYAGAIQPELQEGKGMQVRRGHEIDSYNLLLLFWRNLAPELQTTFKSGKIKIHINLLYHEKY